MSTDLQKKIPVYGELISGVPGGSVTTADQIRDPDFDNHTQAWINQLLKNRKGYQKYPKFEDFPIVGMPDVLYYALDTGFTWEYIAENPLEGQELGWNILSDNWRAIGTIQGDIE